MARVLSCRLHMAGRYKRSRACHWLAFARRLTLHFLVLCWHAGRGLGPATGLPGAQSSCRCLLCASA